MKTTVEWPEGLTRERLMENAEWLISRGYAGQATDALLALAAIAPSGKPETEPRYVWIDSDGYLHQSQAKPSDIPTVFVQIPVLPKKPRTVTMWFYKSGGRYYGYSAEQRADGFEFTREIELEA